jgi:TonB-dependent Receptor Plug Domain/CarboxypepD_reg-like domain
MQNKHFFIILLFLFYQSLIAQKNYTISGYIEDESSGERLIGAAIYDSTARFGTVTNNYGYFNLSIAPNTVEERNPEAGGKGSTYLLISYIGYQTERITLNIRGDTTLNIKLSTKNTLQTVEVNANTQDRIEDRGQMSQVTIPIEQIKRMPMILGEADVLKSLQFLPGVKAGTEGTAGIQVRGGSQDQNLFLLDGVPIYNPTHFGGFFSVFNADALRSVNLIKGGFPARFGGRLSSVVEVDTKDGDKKKFHATGAIGLLMSKLTLEGPILKDKISYMISARRTYIDLPLSGTFNTKTNSNGTTDEKNTDIFFYDINAKFNARIDAKNQLFLSLYQGYDVYAESNSLTGTFDSKPAYKKNGFDLNFKNQIASLRWNRLFNNRLFSNTTLYFTRYNLNYNNFNEFKFDPSPLQKESLNFNTRIEDVALKSDVDYVLNNQQKLKFGFSIIRHGFLPNRITTQITGQRDTIYNDNKEFSLENDVYGEYHYAYKRFDANVGLRVSYFDAKNKGYFALQPRLNLSLKISDNAAIKGAFSSNSQFIHSLTNDALGFPTDSWIPSVQGIRPAQSNQIALGFAKTVWKDYELSVESYYKTMDNLVAYREGDSYLNPDPVWERKVVQGKGKSYGLEVLLQKKEGRLSGWVSYTLAKSTRQFEDINNGEEYPFKYDRRHEFSVVAMWKLTPRISLSANWFLATGNAVTLPSGIYNIPFNGFPNGGVFTSRVIDYGVRNSYRTVPSHRLDIGIEFYKKKRKYERKWQFGIYNVYNHGNPFYFQFDLLPDDMYRLVKIGRIEYARLIETYKLKQINLIPILPYLSYEIKF